MGNADNGVSVQNDSSDNTIGRDDDWHWEYGRRQLDGVVSATTRRRTTAQDDPIL